ncbi:MAG: O-antigen ligase family protein [Bacilli bacterium]
MRITFKKINVGLFGTYIMVMYLFDLNINTLWISKVVFLMFAISTLISLFIAKKVTLNLFFWLFGLFVFYSAISIFWAVESNLALKMTLTLFQLLILGFCVTQTFDKENIEIIPHFFALAGALLFLYSLYIYGIKDFFVSIINSKRLGAQISQENIYGFQSAISIVAALYLMFFKKKYIYVLVCLALLFVIAASGSKSALLIVPIGFIIVILLKYGVNRKVILFFILLIVFSIALLNTPIFKGVIHRIQKMLEVLLYGNTAQDGSTTKRLEFIIEGIVLFFKKPLFGYGADNFRVIIAPILGVSTYSHNNYIELLVNGGIIGFLLFYFSYFVLILEAFSKKLDKFLLIIMILFLIADMATVSLYSKIFVIFLSLGFSSLEGAKNETVEVKKYSTKYKKSMISTPILG